MWALLGAEGSRAPEPDLPWHLGAVWTSAPGSLPGV